MKKALLILVLAALPAAAASASELRMTVEQPRFTCAGSAGQFSHAAYLPHTLADDSTAGNDGAAPLPCCDGTLGCAQFLSTDTVIRQATQWHG